MHLQVNNYMSHTHTKDIDLPLNYLYLAYFHCLESKTLHCPIEVSHRFFARDLQPANIPNKLFHFNDLFQKRI